MAKIVAIRGRKDGFIAQRKSLRDLARARARALPLPLPRREIIRPDTERSGIRIDAGVEGRGQSDDGVVDF